MKKVLFIVQSPSQQEIEEYDLNHYKNYENLDVNMISGHEIETNLTKDLVEESNIIVVDVLDDRYASSLVYLYKNFPDCIKKVILYTCCGSHLASVKEIMEEIGCPDLETIWQDSGDNLDVFFEHLDKTNGRSIMFISKDTDRYREIETLIKYPHKIGKKAHIISEFDYYSANNLSYKRCQPEINMEKAHFIIIYLESDTDFIKINIEPFLLKTLFLSSDENFRDHLKYFSKKYPERKMFPIRLSDLVEEAKRERKNKKVSELNYDLLREILLRLIKRQTR